jgi:energy-coupling factor transport system substrate-specific component
MNQIVNNQKLQAKDLITVGIFTAIYFVIFFACGMLGYMPLFMLLIPFICPFVSGIPFMLYLTKVKKFGMVTITGLICGVLMLLTGMSWPPIITGIGFGLIADFILKSGQYKSSAKAVIAYSVFSIWLMGMMLPLYVMRDSYFADMVPTYGQAYVDAVMAYTPTWSFFVLTALSFLGGLFGAFIGKAVLKKHFKKAGIA